MSVGQNSFQAGNTQDNLKYLTVLEQQVSAVLERIAGFAKVSYILSHLDLKPLTDEAKSVKFSQEALLKLYLYKRIKGISTHPKLLELLERDQQQAYDLGFFKDEDDKLQLPRKRTFNEFMQKCDHTDLLNQASEKILTLATKHKLILDLEIIRQTLTKKSKEISKKNKAFKEAVRLVKKLVYPQIEIRMHHNAKFTTRDMLDILVHLAQTHDFCSNGIMTFSELNPDADIPARETMLYHLKKLNSKEEIEETFRRIFDAIFEFSKKNYNLLSRRKLDLAIDVHNIPYYGDKSDPFVSGGKPERGTSQFFKFITCSIVVAGRRFTIDALMMHPLDELSELVDRLIKRAKEKVAIGTVYLDRGFDSPAVIRTLKQNRVKYLMPKIKSPTVQQWFDKSEACRARIIKDFRIKDETTNLILVDDDEGVKRAFSTNLEVSEPIAHYLFRMYSKRWGIETGYRQMEHDFKPRTTSKNTHIRLFYFLFSACLHNLWVLINICVSIALHGRVLDKPIITSKLFALVLYRVQIDSGG